MQQKLSFTGRLIAAARVITKGEPVLSSVPLWFSQFWRGTEDEVITKKGVAGYLDIAWSDAEVASCLWTGILQSIPGISVQPADDTPEGERNAALIDAVLDAMTGSTVDTFQAGILNAFVTGFTVQEPSYMPVILPGIGTAMGLRSLDVRATESFSDDEGIYTDKYGRILKFKQSATYGGAEVTPEQVVYWAHMGGAENRYGVSMLRPVYEPWAAKQKIRRIYEVFMATNASGIRSASVPKEDFDTEAKQAAALAIMQKLGTLPSIAMLDTWKLNIDIPNSGAGGHFREMLDHCNSEIRRGILGDSAYSSQEGAQGSLASRQQSAANVQSRFAVLGRAYCEAVTEQLCPMILRINGYSGPIPKIVPMPVLSTTEAREGALNVLSAAKQAGLLTETLPPAAQLAIYRMYLEPANITIEETVPKPEPPAQLAPPVAEPTDEEGEEPVAASAPVKPVLRAQSPKMVKRAKQAKKQADEFSSLVDERAKDLSDTWAAIMPEVKLQISRALFEQKPGGGWKTTSLSEIRNIIVEKVRYKSGDIRNSLTAGFEAANDMGKKHGGEMVPVKAAVSFGWSSTTAKQALASRVLFLLEDKYGMLASSMYYAIENALIGNLSILETEARLTALLEDSPWANLRAATIMDTAMATAWSEARLQQYESIVDVNGTGASSIVAYEFLAVEDEHTTDTCLELNGKVFRADDPALPVPPLHYNCRSVLLPVFGDEAGTVDILNTSDSAALVSKLQSNGGIQEGFGGV